LLERAICAMCVFLFYFFFCQGEKECALGSPLSAGPPFLFPQNAFFFFFFTPVDPCSHHGSGGVLFDPDLLHCLSRDHRSCDHRLSPSLIPTPSHNRRRYLAEAPFATGTTHNAVVSTQGACIILDRSGSAEFYLRGQRRSHSKLLL